MWAKRGVRKRFLELKLKYVCDLAKLQGRGGERPIRWGTTGANIIELVRCMLRSHNIIQNCYSAQV